MNLLKFQKLKLKKHNFVFFNKHIFRLFASIYFRKVSFYIFALVYLLILVLFIIVPPLVGWLGSYFFSRPIALVFLIFSLCVVSCFIAIEIFLSSVENGTELLVLSKPVNRISIYVCKLLILNIFLLIISVLTLPLTSIGLTFKESNQEFSKIVIAGVFVGTYVIGLITSSISIFIASFFKKVYTLVIVSCFNIIFLVFSLASTIAIDNDLKNSSVSSNFQRSYVLNMKDYGKNDVKNDVDFSTVLGVYSLNNSSFEEIYNSFQKKRTYLKLLPINFYLQFCNITTLNQPVNYYTIDETMGTEFTLNPYVYNFEGFVFKRSEKGNTNFVNDPIIRINFEDNITNPFSFNLYLKNLTYTQFSNRFKNYVVFNNDNYGYNNLYNDYNNSQTYSSFFECLDQAIDDVLTNWQNANLVSAPSSVRRTSASSILSNYRKFFQLIENIATITLSKWYNENFLNESKDELVKAFSVLTMYLIGNTQLSLDFNDVDNIIDNWRKDTSFLQSLVLNQDTPIYGEEQTNPGVEGQENQDNSVTQADVDQNEQQNPIDPTVAAYRDTIASLVKYRFFGLSLLNYLNYAGGQIANDVQDNPNQSNVSQIFWDYLNPNSDKYSVINANSISSGNLQMNNPLNTQLESDGYVINLPFRATSIDSQSNMETLVTVSCFNTFYLFFFWIVVALILYVISYLIYQKKDYK
ncbi:MAG: ABC transporter permease [Malacoplasma sp.]|nr:ABC transporter permease [Malacoplasma sp.]